MYTISGSGCRQALCSWIKTIVGCVVGAAYLIEDTFTDTDNVTLPNHVPDTAPGGSSWASPIGFGWKISDNKAVCPGGNDQQVMIDSEVADVDVVLASVTLGAERKSTRLNSSHSQISYAVFCLQKKYFAILGTYAGLIPVMIGLLWLLLFTR